MEKMKKKELLTILSDCEKEIANLYTKSDEKEKGALAPIMQELLVATSDVKRVIRNL